MLIGGEASGRGQRDCRGRSLLPLPDEGRCSDVAGRSGVAAIRTQASAIPDAASLVERRLTDERSLIWLRLARLPDGSAIGPLAIVDWTERGLAVRAMASIRAAYDRPRIDMVRLGSASLILLEGRACSDAEGCRVEVRLFRVRAGDLVPLTVHGLGPCRSSIPLQQTQEAEDAHGRRMRRELLRGLVFASGDAWLRERLTSRLMDRDELGDQAPVEGSIDRRLALEGDRLSVGPGLWDDE
ncbi:MAG: hypothetical protein R3A51_18300 [Nannocystaceae bacterium]